MSGSNCYGSDVQVGFYSHFEKSSFDLSCPVLEKDNFIECFDLVSNASSLVLGPLKNKQIWKEGNI